jgi:hypothetical protein
MNQYKGNNMTFAKIQEQLAKNAVDFLLAGQADKSDACMELFQYMKDNSYGSIKGTVELI